MFEHILNVLSGKTDRNVGATVHKRLGRHRYNVNENQTTQIKRERYTLLQKVEYHYKSCRSEIYIIVMNPIPAEEI